MSRGILLPEGLKIIISVIAILILMYLAVSLYGIFSRRTPLDQAGETLDKLVGKIESMEVGENDDYLITAPRKWYVVSYGVGKGPDTCENKNCLCICPVDGDLGSILKNTDLSSADYFYGDGLEKCEFEGVCRDVEGAVINRFYEEFSVSKDFFRAVNWIFLSEIPKSVYLEKDGAEVILSDVNFETPLLNDLLIQKVEQNKYDTNTLVELIVSTVNVCKTRGENIDIVDEQERVVVEKTVKDYIESVEKNNEFLGGIRIFYVKNDILIPFVDEGNVPASEISVRKEIRKLCDADHAVYVEYLGVK